MILFSMSLCPEGENELLTATPCLVREMATPHYKINWITGGKYANTSSIQELGN